MSFGPFAVGPELALESPATAEDALPAEPAFAAPAAAAARPALGLSAGSAEAPQQLPAQIEPQPLASCPLASWLLLALHRQHRRPSFRDSAAPPRTAPDVLAASQPDAE